MSRGRAGGRASAGRGRGRGSSPSAARSSSGPSYNAVPPPPELNTPSPPAHRGDLRATGAQRPALRPPTPTSGAAGRRGTFTPDRACRPGLGSAERRPFRLPLQPSTPSGAAPSGSGRPFSAPASGSRHGRGQMSRSPGSWTVSAEGVAGQGAQRVTFSPDREPGIWKVGPPPEMRFSLGFLKGLAAWAAAKQAEQIQDPQRPASSSASGFNAVTAASEQPDSTGLAAVTEAFAAMQPNVDSAAAAQLADEGSGYGDLAEAAADYSSSPAAGSNDSHSGDADDSGSDTDLRFVPQPPSIQQQRLSRMPADSLTQARAVPRELQDDATSAHPRQPGGGGPAPVQVSLRLECMQLTDTEAGLLAAWAADHAGLVAVRKLWLFDNRLGDEGAAALAPLLASDQLLEVHLSHNMIGGSGAAALLRAVPAPPLEPAAPQRQRQRGPVGPGGRGRGLWLRMEWNQIPVDGLDAVLKEEKQRRGLVADVPAKHQETLQFADGPAHVCMPWSWCQRQAPAAAPLLRELCDLASHRAAQSAGAAAAAAATAGAAAAPPGAGAAAAQCTTAAAAPQTAAAAAGQRAATQPTLPVQQSRAAGAAGGADNGPLLLLPDTSALLAMLGCRAGPSAAPCPLTMRDLQELATAGRFGRALPAEEQAFVLLTDSVAKQLDALKNEAALSQPVRRFLGKGLDACGPAGLDFLTVLGAHEGEGLVVEADAEVAGSRSPWLADNGQRVDAKIVEVALFFQSELTAAAVGGAPAAAAGADTGPAPPMPVVLLSADHAQLSLARSHGLPAARMADLVALPAALADGNPLTASLLRQILTPAATVGLGSKAGRSLQRQFDEAVACLRAVHSELVATQAAAGAAANAATSGDMPPAAALAAVAQALQPSSNAAPAPAPPLSSPSAGEAATPGEGSATCSMPAAAADTTASAGGHSVAPASSPAGRRATAPYSAGWGGLEQGRSLAAAVAAQLEQWEAAVHRRESASRVLRWTADSANASAAASATG